MLRASEARDRATFVELLASAEVHTYLGGPRQHDVLERELPEVPAQRPGHFVVEPVFLTTQTANTASMRLAAGLGFSEAERFRAWDADQWLGRRPATAGSARAPRP